MTDKQRILAEMDLLKQQLLFIETAERMSNPIQEEPVSIWHEPIERPDSNKVVLIMIRCGYIGEPEIPHLAKYDSHNNQYIDEDWTDVCNCPILHHVDSVEKWAYIDDILNLSNVGRTVKNWKEEPVSEDLEVELTSYMENSFTSVEEPDEFLTTVMQKDDLLALARHFANWQKEKDDEEKVLIYKHGFEDCKEQLMAKAVDATVHIDAGNYPYISQIELYDYDKDVPLAKDGDKYKVILIKKD